MQCTEVLASWTHILGQFQETIGNSLRASYQGTIFDAFYQGGGGVYKISSHAHMVTYFSGYPPKKAKPGAE